MNTHPFTQHTQGRSKHFTRKTIRYKLTKTQNRVHSQQYNYNYNMCIYTYIHTTNITQLYTNYRIDLNTLQKKELHTFQQKDYKTSKTQTIYEHYKFLKTIYTTQQENLC